MARSLARALPYVGLAAFCAVIGWNFMPVSPAPGPAFAMQATEPEHIRPSLLAAGQAVPVTLAMPERMLQAGLAVDDRQRILARWSGANRMFADEQSLDQARQQQVLFSTGLSPQAVSQSPLADERRMSDGRQWIQYDMRVLSGRAEGDTFVLPLPHAGAVQGQIDAVDVLQAGLRWRGRILGALGGHFQITQTQADAYAVGSIQTPQGEYLLEVKDGKGWVVESHKEFVLPPGGEDTVGESGSVPRH